MRWMNDHAPTLTAPASGATAPAPAPAPAPHALQRLRHFIQALARLVEQAPAEPELIARGSALLGALVAHDDWLPAAYAQPIPERYQQYLLHADALGRFSVVSFVWGPGQGTPIHDHTVWGLIGLLRGAEESQAYAQDAQGRWQPRGAPHLLLPGDVEALSPTLGDVHRVRNALADQVSVSIHVYGANIGAVHRSVYAEDGARKPFVSGYSNQLLPNLWDLSQERPSP